MGSWRNFTHGIRKFGKSVQHTVDKWRGKDKEREAKRYAEGQLRDENARREHLLSLNDSNFRRQMADINNYRNAMRGFADRQYSAGISNLLRGAMDAENNIRRTMAQRGITSGLDLDSLLGKEYQVARGTSALQGQRADQLAQYQKELMNLNNAANQSYLNTKASILGAPTPAADAYGNVLMSIASHRKGLMDSLFKKGINALFPVPGVSSFIPKVTIPTFNPVGLTLGNSGIPGLGSLLGNVWG